MGPTSKLQSRRGVLAGGVAMVAAACAKPARAEALTVYKTPWCGCCGTWVDRLRAAGLKATVVEQEDLAPLRARYGVPEALASCHTALVEGYVVEGHVPAEDIKRLLKERPRARGLVVPGMPVGSPGMETPAGTREPFETLLLVDGAARVFARHG